MAATMGSMNFFNNALMDMDYFFFPEDTKLDAEQQLQQQQQHKQAQEQEQPQQLRDCLLPPSPPPSDGSPRPVLSLPLQMPLHVTMPTMAMSGDSSSQPVGLGISPESIDSPPSRKRKAESPAEDEGAEDEQEGAEGATGSGKRTKFLERNRVAASRCRQKKKAWTQGLEQSARQAREQHLQLTATIANLKEQVLFLKTEMLKHSGCGCSRIKEYLGNEADQLVNRQRQRQRQQEQQQQQQPPRAPSPVASLEEFRRQAGDDV